ncbi:MAG: hypothetical protein ACK4Q6_10810 [Tepidimonas ignava]|uniref:hypothetical protein n=1 Tax=Tepidimonas ignava TaxID=114249 RepID=UPI00391AA193
MDKQNSIWIYSGRPEMVAVAVERGSPASGGYILAMQLGNGNIRLAATQHPSKYLSAWKHSVRQYGAPEVEKVYVSKPYIRYEPIKRLIAESLKEFKVEETDQYHIDAEMLESKASEILGSVKQYAEGSA